MKIQLGDFKKVDEIWYPHTMTIEQGIQTMELEVSEIQHDVEPEDSELTAPQSVQALIERKKASKKEPGAEKESGAEKEEVKDPVTEPEKQKETDR
jgi:hypothetical protein